MSQRLPVHSQYAPARTRSFPPATERGHEGNHTTPVATPHAQGVGLVKRHFASWDEPLPLDSGETLAPITLAYETYGELSPAGDNAILILHALSGDAHAAGYHHTTDEKPGWWDDMIGPGRAFDTNHYYIICSNVIGGCRGSTGPSSLDPATLRPYATRFPVVTIPDMVRAQVRLLDLLGIERLLAVAGGSMGGFQALEWATAYTERVQGVIAFATTARSSPQTIAWNTIGRHAIMSDSRWRGGAYYGHTPPRVGLALARMMGHVTYLSESELEARFGRTLQNHENPRFSLDAEFAIEHYLTHKGIRFTERFDANSYLYLTKALDYWDLPARYGSLEEALARSHAHYLLFSYRTDWLYPPSESHTLEEALRAVGRPVHHITFDSQSGHDTFLTHPHLHAPVVKEFLLELVATGTSEKYVLL